MLLQIQVFHLAFLLKDFRVSVGKGITFSPGGSHIAGTSTKIHDNTDGEYARAVKTALDTKCKPTKCR